MTSVKSKVKGSYSQHSFMCANGLCSSSSDISFGRYYTGISHYFHPNDNIGCSLTCAHKTVMQLPMCMNPRTGDVNSDVSIIYY